MLTKITLDVKIKTMNKRLNSFFFSILFFISFSFFGCSLDYESDTPEQIRAPEFTFENLELTKIEKGRAKILQNITPLSPPRSNEISANAKFAVAVPIQELSFEST